MKLCRQGSGDVIVDAIVLIMTMSRIAASTIESQAAKVVAIFCVFPTAGPNEAISEDPLEGYSWTIVNKCVNRLALGCREIMGFGVIQHEGPATGKLAEDEHRIAFKNFGHVGDGLDVTGEVIVPKISRVMMYLTA